jgi:hypothetical protein
MWVMKSEYEKDNTIVFKDPFDGFDISSIRINPLFDEDYLKKELESNSLEDNEQIDDG